VDSTYVYWGNDGFTAGSGWLGKTPLAGGPTTKLATGLGRVLGIAVDDTDVYFADAWQLAVMKVPLAGGPVTTIATSPAGFTADATNLYWTGAGNVSSVPKAGGATLTLATGLHAPGAIAVDAASAYWGDTDGTIKKVPLAGGSVTTLAANQSPGYGTNQIAVDATSVYWTTSAGIIRFTPK
jgi:hypothetical protein